MSISGGILLDNAKNFKSPRSWELTLKTGLKCVISYDRKKGVTNSGTRAIGSATVGFPSSDECEAAGDRNHPLEEGYAPPRRYRQRERSGYQDYDRDEMNIMARIHNLRQYFSRKPTDKGERRLASLANESHSSWLKDKKRSEREMLVKKLYCVENQMGSDSAPQPVNLDTSMKIMRASKALQLVGLMVIDTRVCDPRIPAIGTMPVSTFEIDSDIPILDMYRNHEEKGQKIKGKLTGRELQNQDGFSRIVDDQGCVNFGGLHAVMAQEDAQLCSRTFKC
eukprot:Gb_19697 [translate_table: standard]